MFRIIVLIGIILMHAVCHAQGIPEQQVAHLAPEAAPATLTFTVQGKTFGIETGEEVIPCWNENNAPDTFRRIHIDRQDAVFDLIVYAVKDPDFGRRSLIVATLVKDRVLTPVPFTNGRDSFDRLVARGYANFIDLWGNIYCYASDVLNKSGNRRSAKVDKYVFDPVKMCFVFEKSKLFDRIPADRHKLLF